MNSVYLKNVFNGLFCLLWGNKTVYSKIFLPILETFPSLLLLLLLLWAQLVSVLDSVQFLNQELFPAADSRVNIKFSETVSWRNSEHEKFFSFQ